MGLGVAETAKMIVDLSLKGNFLTSLSKVNRELAKTGAKLDETSSRSYRAGQQIGTGIKRGVLLAVGAIGTLTGALALSIKEGQAAANTQKIFAQAVQNSFKSAADTTATLKKRLEIFQRALDNSKPGSKGAKSLSDSIAMIKAQLKAVGAITPQYVSALNAQQTALMNLAGVDDELIKSEQTRLIQMGLSGKATLALTPLILDAAKATGKDLLTVTIAAGKAANGNATALQRLGIQVDKTRFKVDPLAETIRVLNQRFGGTTKALSGSFDVRMAALRENLKNIAENVGIKLLPALTRIVNVVGTQLVPAFGKFVDRILPDITKGLDEFASLLENGGAEKAIRGITDALGPMVDLVKVAAAPVKAIVGAFLSLPKEIQTVLIGAFAVNKLTGGLVTNAAGGLVEAIGKAFLGGIKAPLVNVQGGVVNVGGVPGAGGLGGAVGGLGLGSVGLIAGLVVAGVASIIDVHQTHVQPLQDKGLTHNEILAQQYYNADQATQQQILKHVGQAPSRADFESGNAKLQNVASIIGHSLDELHTAVTKVSRIDARKADIALNKALLPGSNAKDRAMRTLQIKIDQHVLAAEIAKVTKASQRDDRPRIEPAKLQDAFDRAVVPTTSAVGTLQKDSHSSFLALNAATGQVQSQIAAGLEPKVSSVEQAARMAGIQTAAAIRDKDLSIKQNIDVKVNVSAAGVTKSVTIQNRYGPGNGSAGGGFGPADHPGGGGA